jgi:hypothetical protein
MSKMDSELPERLASAGATGLEQRLLRAATNERPTRELSERMARGIGVALPAIGAGGAVGLTAKSAAAAKAAVSSSSFLPWLSGGLAAALLVGGLVALGSNAAPKRAPAPHAPTSTALKAAPELAALPLPSATGAPPTDASPQTADDAATKRLGSAASQRNRASATTNGLAEQVALVDAARAALASGRAEHALGIVHEYQATYPRGAFRPEVAAIKIEALLKLGRKAEARASAERFAAAYGPGPLAERVTRLADIKQPQPR